MARQCLCCKKFVEESDEKDHLLTNHLGPHYFWFDAVKFRTMEPSMLVADLKRLVNASSIYPVCEEREGGDVYWGDGVCVDLTHEPHFYALPPATYF